jgi:hypothetical protein
MCGHYCCPINDSVEMPRVFLRALGWKLKKNMRKVMIAPPSHSQCDEALITDTREATRLQQPSAAYEFQKHMLQNALLT